MAGFPIVFAVNGQGFPVIETPKGAPVRVAQNGLGAPVVFVTNGYGAPVSVGAFTDEFSAWQQLPGDDLSATVDGTEVTLVRGSGGIEAIFFLVFSAIPGETYSITGTIGTSAMSVRVGTSIGNGSMMSENVSVGALSDTFTATSSPAVISLWPVGENTTSVLSNLDVALQA